MRMRKFKYDCDGGCIMLGNASSRVCFPNGFGDGEFTVYVCDKNKKDTKHYEFLGTVSGSVVNIYSYDCLWGDELLEAENIRYTLPEGRYAVYANSGTIILEKWD